MLIQKSLIVGLAWIATGLFLAGSVSGQTEQFNNEISHDFSNASFPAGFYLVERWCSSKTDLLPLLPNEIMLTHDPKKLDADTDEPAVFLTVTQRHSVAFSDARKIDQISQPDNRINLGVTLDETATDRLESLTRNYLGRQVAVVIDDEAITLHKIRSIIRDGKIQVSRCTDDGCRLILEELKIRQEQNSEQPAAVQETEVQSQPNSSATQTPEPPPEARQFDFWIGSWNVLDVNGVQVGTNTIESILNGRVLHESWRGTGGSIGHSFNIFSNGQWHQTWVDNQGTLLQIDGKFEDGQMVLEGSTTNSDGQTVLDRITWKPLEDGRVKQHWQKSTDEGKTWSDAFVGFYVKKSAEAAAIERVLEADNRFGAQRNEYCREVSLDSTVLKYVDDMRSIDFTGCPAEFTDAFASHIKAWEDSIEFLKKHSTMRGEMHELFAQIKSVSDQDKHELEASEKEIWGTWSKLEETATSAQSGK